jgi:hypothetical protein
MCLIYPVALLHSCRFQIAKPLGPYMDESDDIPKLTPVKTVCIMVRNVPFPTKQRLMRIRMERGWTSWLDMVDEVVKLWDAQDNEG